MLSTNIRQKASKISRCRREEREEDVQMVNDALSSPFGSSRLWAQDVASKVIRSHGVAFGGGVRYTDGDESGDDRADPTTGRTHYRRRHARGGPDGARGLCRCPYDRGIPA